MSQKSYLQWLGEKTELKGLVALGEYLLLAPTQNDKSLKRRYLMFIYVKHISREIFFKYCNFIDLYHIYLYHFQWQKVMFNWFYCLITLEGLPVVVCSVSKSWGVWPHRTGICCNLQFIATKKKQWIKKPSVEREKKRKTWDKTAVTWRKPQWNREGNRMRNRMSQRQRGLHGEKLEMEKCHEILHKANSKRRGREWKCWRKLRMQEDWGWVYMYIKSHLKASLSLETVEARRSWQGVLFHHSLTKTLLCTRASVCRC